MTEGEGTPTHKFLLAERHVGLHIYIDERGAVRYDAEVDGKPWKKGLILNYMGVSELAANADSVRAAAERDFKKRWNKPNV